MCLLRCQSLEFKPILGKNHPGDTTYRPSLLVAKLHPIWIQAQLRPSVRGCIFSTLLFWAHELTSLGLKQSGSCCPCAAPHFVRRALLALKPAACGKACALHFWQKSRFPFRHIWCVLCPIHPSTGHQASSQHLSVAMAASFSLEEFLSWRMLHLPHTT